MKTKIDFNSDQDKTSRNQDLKIQKQVCENNFSHLKWGTKFNIKFSTKGLEYLKQGDLQNFLKTFFNLPTFKKENQRFYQIYFEQLRDFPMLVNLERNRSEELFREFVDAQINSRNQIKKSTSLIEQLQLQNQKLTKSFNKMKQEWKLRQNLFEENQELQRQLDKITWNYKKLFKGYQNLESSVKYENSNQQVKLEIFESQCIKNKIDDYKIIENSLLSEINEIKDQRDQLKMKIEVNEDNKKNWKKELQKIKIKIKCEQQKLNLIQDQQIKLNKEIKMQQQINDLKNQNQQAILKIQNFENNIVEFQKELQSKVKSIRKKKRNLIQVRQKIEHTKQKLNNQNESVFNIKPEQKDSLNFEFPKKSQSIQRRIKTGQKKGFYPDSQQLKSFRRCQFQTNTLQKQINQNFIFSLNNLEEEEIKLNSKQKLKKVLKNLLIYRNKKDKYYQKIGDRLKSLKWKIKSSFFLINQKIMEQQESKNLENEIFVNQNLLKNLDETFNSNIEAFSFKNKKFFYDRSRDEFNTFVNKLEVLLKVEIQNTQNFFQDCLKKIDWLVQSEQTAKQTQTKYEQLKKTLSKVISETHVKSIQKTHLMSIISDTTIKKHC